jgi:hypothetical protein
VNDLNDLTSVALITIADALTHYALAEGSNDERIRRVIATLGELGYTETASTLDRLSRDRRLPLVERIDAYSVQA